MPPSSGLLFMQLGFMQRLTTLPTCQLTKFVNVVKETGSHFQLPMCWWSEERELVDAPERVTPLALETWNWDATTTSNDAKSNL